MADVELLSIEVDLHGEGATDVKHAPEVLAALAQAAGAVYARAKSMSASGEAEYYYGTDVLPTTSKGYVVTANVQAMAANSRDGTRPLEAAIR